MSLKQLFDKHGADKGTVHQYWTEYDKYFNPGFSGNFLEVGIWHGTSTCAFHEYMPNAELYGIDVFERIPMSKSKCYGLDRVHLLKADSLSDDLPRKIRGAWGDNISFDVVIDDGKHTPEANRKTFENVLPFLHAGSVYYIEDVWPLDILTDSERAHPWLRQRRHEYQMEQYNKFLETIGKYHYERIDLRKQSGKPDSYIFKIFI